MPRADAIAFPFLMNQPISRRIAKVRGYQAERFRCDKARLAEEAAAFGGGQTPDNSRWRDPGSPENFVGHPVADPGETALQKKDGFDRCAGVTPEEGVEEASIEFG